MIPLSNFGPGPSQISPETYADLQNFAQQKYGEISHRSAAFSAISQAACEGLRTLWNLPPQYQIVWGSSATQMMELSIQSTVRSTSFHFTCGAFSERYQKVSHQLGKKAAAQAVPWGEINDFSAENSELEQAEVITLTQCETSTGAAIPLEVIKNVRERFPNQLLFIDATSAAGILPLEANLADGWLFSVQKGFGLPAGLGVFIFHPRVLERAKTFPNPMGVWNLPAMAAQMDKAFQTIETPNVLGIYLLSQQLQRWNQSGGFAALEKSSAEKYDRLTQLVKMLPEVDFFISVPEFRSPSVLCYQASPEVVEELHQKAQAQQVMVGKGYGKIKAHTFRLANFPAITMRDIERLEKAWIG